MDARELRIGNYVYYGKRNSTGKIIMFLGTEAIQLDETPFLGYEEDFHDKDVSEIKPIPLTEEWLLKFGFEKNQSIWILNEIEISSWLIFKFSLSPLKVKKIDYVHQLQNLYFALTNKELTI